MHLEGTGIWSADLRMHRDGGELADAAAELEALGYTALWIPGGAGGKVLEAIERLLAATTAVPVATGILNVWMHDAEEVARKRAALVAAHGDRFLLGLGISHQVSVDREVEGRYRKPVATMRAYLDALDAAPDPVPADARILAALGPRMLALAAERTLGTHPYFVPVEHTRVAREAVGPDAVVAPEQAVVLETDPEKARAVARGHMEIYLTLPNYTNNLLRAGFTEDDVRDGGSDRLVDAIVAWGDAEAIRARVDEHRAAGADHVCVQVITGRQGELPLAEWRALAPALLG